MNVNVILVNKDSSNILKNMYPLYLHDIAEIYGTLPNEYGIFEDGPIKTLIEQYEVQNIWFEKEDILFPFIIYTDNKPAGFALVGSKQYAPKSCDYLMYDYFILRPYRGKNIAKFAAEQVFSKCNGEWRVYTNPNENNKRGQAFWRKTINHYTSGVYREFNGDTFDGYKIIFSFNNKSNR